MCFLSGLYVFAFFFFFFSSRRRHTRLTCDWSSDVCSSDLEASLFAAERSLHRRGYYRCRLFPQIFGVVLQKLAYQLLHIFIGNAARYTGLDRKSTRLNSSHMSISYAVFCLKKKNTI